METDRWQQILTLSDAALSLPLHQRKHYLDRICGEDSGLLSEVEQFLNAVDESEAFWEEWLSWKDSRFDELMQDLPILSESPAETESSRLGPWRLLRMLGSGGMGKVWLAERADGLYERQAALKIVHFGLDMAETLSRFEQEREILAQLDHPYIATLYDAGITDNGRPWLAMEYANGMSITKWCRVNNIPLDQRIDLFIQVCEAVQYAHSHLIVHRDLKPEHILVTESESGVAVKILDFGIAKLLDDHVSRARRIQTHKDVRVMSLEYAAPEQIRGEPVTTATDVYALGLVLYELLTDTFPFRLDDKKIPEIEKMILEQEPEKPGNRAAGFPGKKGLSGDLDAIILKALRKEPQHRYSSAENLLEDIIRFQNNLPVAARQGNLRYRTGKFCRRHAKGLTIGAAVWFGFIAMVGLYTFQISKERDLARKEEAKAEQTATFLKNLFSASDPGEALGMDITARELLDRGAAHIDHELEDEPLVKAGMYNLLGEVYRNMGQYQEAETMLEHAVSLYRNHSERDNPDLAESLTNMGILELYRGSTGSAVPFLDEALQIYRSSGPEYLDEVASVLNNMAAVHLQKNDLDEAERLLREAIALRRAADNNPDSKIATNLDGLATTLTRKGNLDEAEKLFREALQIRRQQLDSNHPDVARSLNNVAWILHRSGNYENAEPMYREALTIWRQVLGDEHPDVATALNNLAAVVEKQNRLGEATQLYRESLKIKQSVLGSEHISVARTLNNLGLLLRAQKEYTEAESLLIESINIRRSVLGEVHPDVARGLNSLALLYKDMENYDRALDYYRQELAVWDAIEYADSMRIATAKIGLGESLSKLSRYEEAERILLESYAELAPGDETTTELSRTALEQIVQLYLAWNKFTEAERYKALLPP